MPYNVIFFFDEYPIGVKFIKHNFSKVLNKRFVYHMSTNKIRKYYHDTSIFLHRLRKIKDHSSNLNLIFCVYLCLFSKEFSLHKDK